MEGGKEGKKEKKKKKKERKRSQSALVSYSTNMGKRSYL